MWLITYTVFVWNGCIVFERDIPSAPTSWKMSLYSLVMLLTFGWIVDKGVVPYMTLAYDLGVRPHSLWFSTKILRDFICYHIFIIRDWSSMQYYVMHIHVIHNYLIIRFFMLFIVCMWTAFVASWPSAESASKLWSEGNLVRQTCWHSNTCWFMIFEAIHRVSVKTLSVRDVGNRLSCW